MMSHAIETLDKPTHHDSKSDRAAKRVMWLYIGSGLVLVGAMVIAGLGMRMAQGGMHTFQPGLFYSLMTLHGSAMMVGMALCGMGLLWYLFTQEEPLNPTTAVVACALILVGAVLVGIACVVMGWTIWCLQMLGGALTRYGGLRGAFAWDLVWSPKKFAATGQKPPPPQAFAVLVSAVDGLLAGSAGMLAG